MLYFIIIIRHIFCDSFKFHYTIYALFLSNYLSQFIMQVILKLEHCYKYRFNLCDFFSLYFVKIMKILFRLNFIFNIYFMVSYFRIDLIFHFK